MLDDLFALSREMVRILNRPYERYFIRGVKLEGRCSIVAGKRGIGKTTTLVQHLLKRDADIRTSRQTLYVPVDHFVVRGAPLYEIAKDFALQGGRRLYVDEIHKYPQWSRDLKSIYDTFPDVSVIASGSSMMQIRKGSHDLSRRAVVYRMTGMSFREFLEMRFGIGLPVLDLESVVKKHESIVPELVDMIRSVEATPLGAFGEYLRFGVYPYHLEYDDHELFRATLEQSVHTAIESDLPAVHPQLTGTSTARIKMLLSAIASSVPLTPDLAKLKRLLGIADDRTLKSYMGYLEDAGLIMAFGKTGRDLKAMEKPRKIYLGDVNEAYALQPIGRVNTGSLRETFFAQSVSVVHTLRIPDRGDFETDSGIVFEVGGRNKTASQIQGHPNAYLAVDDVETGVGARIPLWVFGFLY